MIDQRFKRKLHRVMRQKALPPPPVAAGPIPSSGITNVAAMRPNLSFIPYDQQSMDMRLYQDKLAWRKANPNDDWCKYPGMPDPYGRTAVRTGAGECSTSTKTESEIHDSSEGTRTSQINRTDLTYDECMKMGGRWGELRTCSFSIPS